MRRCGWCQGCHPSPGVMLSVARMFPCHDPSAVPTSQGLLQGQGPASCPSPSPPYPGPPVLSPGLASVWVHISALLSPPARWPTCVLACRWLPGARVALRTCHHDRGCRGGDHVAAVSLLLLLYQARGHAGQVFSTGTSRALFTWPVAGEARGTGPRPCSCGAAPAGARKQDGKPQGAREPRRSSAVGRPAYRSSPGLESHEIVSGGPGTPCSLKHQALCGWFPFSTPQPFLMPLALPPPLPPFPQQGAAPRGDGRRLWRGEVGGGSSFLRRAQPLLRASTAGPLQIRGLRVQHILPYGLGQGWG